MIDYWDYCDCLLLCEGLPSTSDSPGFYLYLTSKVTNFDPSTMAENLSQLIKINESYCLNEDPAAPYANIFSTGSSSCLKSLADEQLLLHLAFSQASKLTKITLGLPTDTRCPKTIKVFVNPDSSMDFDDAGSRIPIQTVNVSEIPSPDDSSTRDSGHSMLTITLAPLKWKNTQSLSLFVEDNHGAEFSALTFFSVQGSTNQGADLSKGMPSC